MVDRKSRKCGHNARQETGSRKNKSYVETSNEQGSRALTATLLSNPKRASEKLL